MSIERKRTEMIYAIFRRLVSGGRTAVRPGDIASALRDRGQPLGSWEVRGELSTLEAQGLICCNEDTGAWQLPEKGASLKKTG